MKSIKKDDTYYKAKERVTEIKKFYTSFMMYVLFICFLAGINYYVNELRHPWFLWAALGWGIGLIFQGAKAFNWNPFLGKDWEERKMQEYIDKENNNF